MRFAPFSTFRLLRYLLPCPVLRVPFPDPASSTLCLYLAPSVVSSLSLSLTLLFVSFSRLYVFVAFRYSSFGVFAYFNLSFERSSKMFTLLKFASRILGNIFHRRSIE